MKLNYLLIALLGIIFSCQTKTYKYIEVVQEKGLLYNDLTTTDKKPENISAISDSDAYMQAYNKFCIALKVDQEMKKSFGGTTSTPVEFKLLNEKGMDIRNVVAFSGKAEAEQKTKAEVFSMHSILPGSASTTADEKDVKVLSAYKPDSGRAKQLSKYFRIKKDEFSQDGVVWYEPKSAPQFTNRNGLYCYFQTANASPQNFRLRLQYYADDWLFFKTVQFSIDGKAYEYTPLHTETDNGDGGYVWEWSDEQVTDTDKELVIALANAKTAKMKLIGRQYYKIKPITPEQIASIKRTLELYRSMGGDF